MTAEAWLIVVTLTAFVLWVVAGVIDSRAEREPLPRITQPVRATPPPLPFWMSVDMRSARTARARRGRHARPEASQ